MAADSSHQMTKILRQTSQNTMACESPREEENQMNLVVWENQSSTWQERGERALWVEMLAAGARQMKK